MSFFRRSCCLVLFLNTYTIYLSTKSSLSLEIIYPPWELTYPHLRKENIQFLGSPSQEIQGFFTFFFLRWINLRFGKSTARPMGSVMGISGDDKRPGWRRVHESKSGNDHWGESVSPELVEKTRRIDMSHGQNKRRPRSKTIWPPPKNDNLSVHHIHDGASWPVLIAEIPSLFHQVTRCKVSHHDIVWGNFAALKTITLAIT